MAFGKFDSDSEDEVLSEINMIPLIDVMLVLLIVFIITVPVIRHAVQLELPQATSQPSQERPATIRLAEGRPWSRSCRPLPLLQCVDERARFGTVQVLR